MGIAGATESKVTYAQAGMEATVQVLMSALSGAAPVNDLGFLDWPDIELLTFLLLCFLS